MDVLSYCPITITPAHSLLATLLIMETDELTSESEVDASEYIYKEFDAIIIIYLKKLA